MYAPLEVCSHVTPCFNHVGRREDMLLSQLNSADRPLVIQFSGTDPVIMAEAARCVAFMRHSQTLH